MTFYRFSCFVQKVDLFAGCITVTWIPIEDFINVEVRAYFWNDSRTVDFWGAPSDWPLQIYFCSKTFVLTLVLFFFKMIHRISAYKSKKLGFEIPDLKIFNGSYGTLSEPHLFKVVYGQNFQKSLRKGSDIQNMLKIWNKSLNHAIFRNFATYFSSSIFFQTRFATQLPKL